MFGLHMPELIIVLVIALLIFGPKKLPEMGSSIGRSIKEFRKGMNEIATPKEEKLEEPKTPSAINLDAIEREIASKKATHEVSTSASEAVHAETRAE